MNKIGLIIKREYTTRVRKRSFIVMSILGPILFASLMVVPALIAMSEDQEVKRIAVVDSSHLFMNIIPETEYLKFDYLENARLNDIKQTYSTGGYYGVLYISHIVAFEPNSVIFYSDKQPSLATKMHISKAMENYIRDQKLKTYEIENLDNILKSVRTSISIRTIKILETGQEKESHTGVAMAVGYLGGFLIYMFIFFFGAQLMRGVIEEKVNRIVEVIISSVKPFQLMMGKIIGIAMVGLTQFMIWVVTTFLLVTITTTLFFPEMNMTPTEQVISQDIMSSGPVEAKPEAKSEDMNEIMGFLSGLKDINFVLTLGSFIFYFLGGYLLYGAMFAAIGAAVDNETDTQQFMLPLTIPLILALLVLINSINNPDSSVSFWFSIIPFTAPIVMMGRLPFGVPDWEVGLSMALLVVTFIGMTWLAAKIYRTGIL
ncbi:MAG: ABC transporter permease, partial [Bacteroidales bacterium]|nr:ABC transporter permease [Bacteroidales bacterium]